MSNFEPAAPLPPFLFPIPTDGETRLYEFNPDHEPLWPELVKTFTERAVQTPLIFSAPEYQLEPLYYLVCKKCRVPAPAGSVYGLPLAREIIALLKPDILITQPKLAFLLLGDLAQHNIRHSFPFVFVFSTSRDTDQEESLIRAFPKTIFTFHTHPFI